MNFIFKLIGWFFSNIFIILVVLIASYAFVYWDDPFGEDTPAGKVMAAFPDEVETVKSWVAKLDPDHGFEVDEMSSDETTEVASVASGSEEDRSAGSADDSGSTSAGASSAEDASTVASTAAGETDAQAVDDANYVTPELEQALSQISSDGSVEDDSVIQQVEAAERAESASQKGGTGSQAMSADARQTMIDARRAFLKRDYDTCIASYEKLIASDTDNFDALGELGNVYFTQGEMEKAADAYYRAATAMVANGQVRRAGSLVGFLRSVDRDKAEELQKLVDQQDETVL